MVQFQDIQMRRQERMQQSRQEQLLKECNLQKYQWWFHLHM